MSALSPQRRKVGTVRTLVAGPRAVSKWRVLCTHGSCPRPASVSVSSK